jgi:glycosyltransferase involved in cell wall biosynthesis
MVGVTIDITRLLVRGLEGRLPTGVDRVSLEYLRYFRSRANALVRYNGHWLFLSKSDSGRLIDAMLAPCDRFKWTVRWLVFKAYVRAAQPKRGMVLLNTAHSGLEDPGYAHRARRLGLRPVYFLHDLIPLTHAEYCSDGEAAKHRQRLTSMLSGGCGIIVNSNATRMSLAHYAQDVGDSAFPPSVVALLAPARLPQPAIDRPVPERYFVVLGTIEPRKNHLLLLHVWRQLVQEMGSAAPRLVIVGQRGWECEQVLDLLDRCEALRGVVLEKSRCSDAEMATWLFHAQALLFPSFIEGYGMPMVEALQMGVPVLASDLPVFREIAGDVPEYLNPIDGVGWRRQILEYAQPESSAREAQCLRMRDFRAPTWAQHFVVVEALLAQVSESHRQ